MIMNTYRNLKLQTKLTIALAITVLLPYGILVSLFYGRLSDMIAAETIRTAQQSAAQTAPLVNDVIDNITEKSLELSTSQYFKDVFYTTDNANLTALSQSQEAREFKEQVEALKKYGINVRIYMGMPFDFDFYTAQNSNDIFFPMKFATGTYWHGIFQGLKCSKLYCPSAYLSHSEIDNLGDNAYITYMTIHCNDSSYPCYMALYYNSSLYENILNEHMTFTDGVSYIINDREEIIATTNAGLSSTYRLGYDSIQESLLSSNSFVERDVLDQSVFVAFHYINGPDWYLVTVIPQEPIKRSGQQLLTNLFLIIILCLLLGIFLAYFQSRSITSRISKIIHQMSEVRNGPPIPLEESEYHDEVGELINTYNYMAVKMQHLIEQEQKTAENLRYAEFNALQAQINPHFLYNTMDMINWMAKEGRTDEVSEVVQRLSRFYKLTLSKKNTINSIADELEHVSIYVELQNMRHGNPIDFVVDMPDELSNFSIPKLTLQPIVENAINHGILEKDSKKGAIIITGWEEDEDIIILVSDDGVGIGEDKLKDVLKELPSGPSKGSNVAVSNIHQRLKLLCGPEYGLTYSSVIGQGTEVTIRIPKLIG